ncbi:MAG: hypothetical protein Q8N91_06305 [Candidatus Omnitrophota bacterium]|nr:hypothetical protein [Candidatus Omnitrophota bacterium]
MGLKSQFQIKMKQAQKRKKKRKKLAAKGQPLNEYFYGKYVIKLGTQ